jgi:hypothetical protein
LGVAKKYKTPFPVVHRERFSDTFKVASSFLVVGKKQRKEKPITYSLTLMLSVPINRVVSLDLGSEWVKVGI